MSKFKDIDNYLTVAQYADKYQVSINTVYKQIRHGLHKTYKKGSVMLIFDQKPSYRTNNGPQVFANPKN